VLWQGGGQVILSRITLGELIAFYTFMTRLIFPMVALGFVTNIFQRGGASMGRLNYILDSELRSTMQPSCKAERRNSAAKLISGILPSRIRPREMIRTERTETELPQ